MKVKQKQLIFLLLVVAAAIVAVSQLGMIFALKVVLVPALIGGVTIAGRIWGHQVSGLLSSFPIVLGPILYFLVLEQGNSFGSDAAASGLRGVLALIVFCVVFTIAAQTRPWWFSYIQAIGSYFVSCIALTSIPQLPLLLVFAVVVAAIVFAMRWLPKSRIVFKGAAIRKEELIARMIFAECLVLALTGTAAIIGPQWSGVLAPFPVAGTVLSIFTLRVHGYQALTSMMKGFISGFLSATFFLFALALLLEDFSLNLSFAIAVTIAVIAHTTILRLRSRPA